MSANAERIARRFHQVYEDLAPFHGYKTRTESAVPWDQVPEANRSLMIDVVDELLNQGIIEPGELLQERQFIAPPGRHIDSEKGTE